MMLVSNSTIARSISAQALQCISAMARVCSRDVEIHPLPALITAQNRGRSIQAKYLPHCSQALPAAVPHSSQALPAGVHGDTVLARWRRSQALGADKGIDGMAEAVERNLAPRILDIVPAQLSHSSTKLEDLHHAEIVGKLDRGSLEPQQRPAKPLPAVVPVRWRRSQALAAVEPNMAPRILGDVPAQLSHFSTKLEDSHHAEIVGKLDRGDGEPQQQPAIKKPQQTQAKYLPHASQALPAAVHIDTTAAALPQHRSAAKYLPHAIWALPAAVHADTVLASERRSQVLPAAKGIDGMAEAVEQNVVPRILGDVPAQLSHSSAKLEDSHHAEIVGKLDRGHAEPQQRSAVKKPQRPQRVTASLRESSVVVVVVVVMVVMVAVFKELW